MIVSYYEVRVIADCEGRTMKVVARFTLKKDAEAFANTSYGCDFNGHKGSVHPMTLSIYEDLYTVIEEKSVELKKTALAKLNKQEREALGV